MFVDAVSTLPLVVNPLTGEHVRVTTSWTVSYGFVYAEHTKLCIWALGCRDNDVEIERHPISTGTCLCGASAS